MPSSASASRVRRAGKTLTSTVATTTPKAAGIATKAGITSASAR